MVRKVSPHGEGCRNAKPRERSSRVRKFVTFVNGIDKSGRRHSGHRNDKISIRGLDQYILVHREEEVQSGIFVDTNVKNQEREATRPPVAGCCDADAGVSPEKNASVNSEAVLEFPL